MPQISAWSGFLSDPVNGYWANAGWNGSIVGNSMDGDFTVDQGAAAPLVLPCTTTR